VGQQRFTDAKRRKHHEHVVDVHARLVESPCPSELRL
jgi:hypothetical protein